MPIDYTPKQHATMVFIAKFMREKGYAPSLREISVARGVSTSSVHELLRALKSKGAIAHKHYSTRNLEILDGKFIIQAEAEDTPKDAEPMPLMEKTRAAIVSTLWCQQVSGKLGEVETRAIEKKVWAAVKRIEKKRAK